MVDISFTCQIDEITEAVNYMLKDGKKLRAKIIWNLGNQSEISKHFANAVEFLHNASLILDDLPCMDNSDTRRDKPSLHRFKSEYIAQLSAMTLLSRVQSEIYRGLTLLEQDLPVQDYKIISKYLMEKYISIISDSGITGGQYHDLSVKKYIHTLPLRKQQELILQIMKLKTGVLFELTLILGYISSLGRSIKKMNNGIINQDRTIHDTTDNDIQSSYDLQTLHQYGILGLNLGICYQIIDDLRDRTEESLSNLCKYFKKNEIIDLFVNFLKSSYQIIQSLKINNEYILKFYRYLNDEFKKFI